MTTNHSEMMNSNYAQQQPPADSRLLKTNQVSDNDYFVDETWLKAQIDQQNPELIVLDVTRGAGDYRLDVTRVDTDYEQQHIPGAYHMSTDELGEFKDYFKPPAELRDAFLQKGITRNTLLVVYSAYARDIMYIASRVAFAAYYLGVDRVKILDGGIQAWATAGYAFESGCNVPTPAADFGIEGPARGDLLISTPDDLLRVKTENPAAVLASVRTWNEFIGQNEGHAWNKGVGEIAGSVYAGDEKLGNIEGKMADPSTYLADWEDWGILPDKQVIFYCGTGWRSSTAFFVAKHLGWENIYLYDGSWFKWYLAHEANPGKYPIQRGNPKEPNTFRVIDTP